MFSQQLDTVYNVRDFGAAGDGAADDTSSIQSAIDEAATREGIVFIPPGHYCVGELQLRPHIELCGAANFSFRDSGGSVLRLREDARGAKCLLNLTGAYGCCVKDLCLAGRGMGDSQLVHGMLIDKPDYGKQEDTPTIDNCRIEQFSGDGIHLDRIWCFSVRHSHCFRNGGCGLLIRGWDGFILDNWFSGNKGAGFATYGANASVTMTGNRIEWNAQGGIVVKRGEKYNITGNYIDRSGIAGIILEDCSDIAVTGNMIYRSGKVEWTPDAETSAHAILSGRGIAFTGNSLAVGRDDGSKGVFSPLRGMLLGNLENSVISGNTLHRACLKELIGLTGTQTNCVIKDNPGSIAVL